MRATGIVRRIDDLGRIVVPKEIRRTLRIREGDPLEIFTDREGEIILKKYSPIGELSTFAKQYAEAMAQATGHIIVISDKDQFIAVSGGGSKRDWLGKPISRELERAIDDRSSVAAMRTDKTYIRLTPDDDEVTWQVVTPIIAEGDAIGAVMVVSKESKGTYGEGEMKLSQTAANFLGKQMED